MSMLPTNCMISEWTDWSNCQQGKKGLIFNPKKKAVPNFDSTLF